MARTILLMAAAEDYEQLVLYCEEIGLRLLPMMIGKSIPAPKDGPVCYLGRADSEGLHPYGNPPLRLADVRDPLLLFARPYHAPPFLIDGQISLNEDNRAVSNLIKPHFEKIRRWVRKNWVKRGDQASYVGPIADQLLSNGSAVWRSQLYGVPSEVIIVNRPDD
jgi:hypothetical protein